MGKSWKAPRDLICKKTLFETHPRHRHCQSGMPFWAKLGLLIWAEGIENALESWLALQVYGSFFLSHWNHSVALLKAICVRKRTIPKESREDHDASLRMATRVGYEKPGYLCWSMVSFPIVVEWSGSSFWVKPQLLEIRKYPPQWALPHIGSTKTRSRTWVTIVMIRDSKTPYHAFSAAPKQEDAMAASWLFEMTGQA